jgi:hypothetical protein
MTCRRYRRTAARSAVMVVGGAAAAYATCVAAAWLRYGRARPPTAAEADPLLDRFMPQYDVVDRHHVAVAAPAAVVLAAAGDMDLRRSPLVQAIFRAREIVLGATPERRRRGRGPGLLAEMQSIGWQVLAEIPGREVIAGAVTRPWEADVTFRPIPPEAFAGFDEPGYVKIVWTLRADPAGVNAAIFRTETRAAVTDAAARRRFRRYWSFFSPGIRSIRWLLLAPLKAEAERRAWRGSENAGERTGLAQVPV